MSPPRLVTAPGRLGRCGRRGSGRAGAGRGAGRAGRRSRRPGSVRSPNGRCGPGSRPRWPSGCIGCCCCATALRPSRSGTAATRTGPGFVLNLVSFHDPASGFDAPAFAEAVETAVTALTLAAPSATTDRCEHGRSRRPAGSARHRLRFGGCPRRGACPRCHPARPGRGGIRCTGPPVRHDCASFARLARAAGRDAVGRPCRSGADRPTGRRRPRMDCATAH